MGSRLRLVTLTVALVSTLSGCAGSSWQFWKSSSSPETPAEPVTATAAPTPPTAMPVSPASDLASHGFVPRPELADVRFRPGYVTVNKADGPVLDNALRWLKEHPDTVVRIEGHSDDVGTLLAEVTGTTPTYTFRGDEIYVRALVTSSKLKANPYSQGEFQKAWTQPWTPSSNPGG